MTILTTIEGLIGPWQAVAIGAGLALAIGTAGGAYVTHRIDQASYEALELAQAKASTAALEKAVQDAVADERRQNAAAMDFARQQQKEEDAAHAITRTIIDHIHDDRPCITFGFVRVLNAAAAGVPVDSETIAPGQSDDTCAPVSWRQLAIDVANDYAAGRLNAQQLNDLIVAVTPAPGAPSPDLPATTP